MYTIIMDEFEIISDKIFKTTVESLSVKELEEYKLRLKEFIKKIDNTIKNRELKKYEAEKIFKDK